MLTFLVTLALTAAPFNARITPDARLAVHLPVAKNAASLRPFFDQAGNYSALLRPEAWRDDAHPLLGIDVTRAETMEAAGIDVQGPLTLSASAQADWTYTCLRLKNPAAYDKATGARLATLGTPFRKTQSGATVVGAKDAVGRVVTGYVTVGNQSCAVRAPNGDGEAALKSAVTWLKQPAWTPWKPPVALAGDAFIYGASGAMGMTASTHTATFDAVNTEGLTPALSTAAVSPYTLEGPAGLLKARVQYAKESVPSVVNNTHRMLARLCPRCDQAVLSELTTALEKQMTGNVMLYVAEAKVQGSLKQEAARFAALKSALLVELGSAAAAQALLEPANRYLDSGKAPLKVSAQGTHVVISNDAAAAANVTRFISANPSRPKHAADFAFDAKLAAQALSQIPLFEALSSSELAGLFAASAEVGPLLLHTEAVQGWADGGGKGPLRAQLVWTLSAAK